MATAFVGYGWLPHAVEQSGLWGGGVALANLECDGALEKGRRRISERSDRMQGNHVPDSPALTDSPAPPDSRAAGL